MSIRNSRFGCRREPGGRALERPELAWDRGIHLVGSILWLDAQRPDVLTFLSSARVREAGRHLKALCTDRTRTLVRVMRPDFSPLVAPFGQGLRLGPLDLTMHPSGHMPGAAILRVAIDGAVVLYASHVAQQAHAMAEAPQVPTGDVLVVRADYGHLGRSFPARTAALEQVVDVARRSLESGRSPVFLGSVMGKSQEVVRALTAAGVPVMVHRSIAAVNRAYRDLGFDPGRAHQFRGVVRNDHALVMPETLRFRRSVEGIKGVRLIWLSGRALMPEVLARMRVDEGIPLTGHLDPAGLERLVRMTGARRLYTVGHGAETVAASARRRGIEAQALHGEVQLALF